jgi:hypothetical protein
MATHHWDVRSDVPDHLVGAYDIVHIRNFAFVLQDAEVESVIRNLFRLTSKCLRQIKSDISFYIRTNIYCRTWRLPAMGGA